MGWQRRAALLLVLFVGMVGCASPSSTAVDRWAVDGKAVSLPGNVAPLLPARGGRIHMQANVDVPPELRGAPLSLAFNVQWCEPELSANGVHLDDVERSPLDGERSHGPHLYRIPSVVAGDRLSLTMEIEDTYEYCSLFQTAPTLSRGDFGSASYVAVRRINEIPPLFAVALLPLLGGALVALYFTGGRRASQLWAAAGCLLFIGNPVGFLGVAHYFVGYRGDAVYMVGGLLGGFAMLRFTFSYLELPPPSAVWTVVVACAIVAVPLTMHRYDESAMWIEGQVVSIAIYVRVLAAWARHRKRSQNGLLVLLTLSAVMPLFFLESLPLLGLPDLLRGAHLSYLAWVFVASVILVAFMRDHGAAARDLRAQLAAAEARQRDIVALSDELRHQVARRSRELRDALVRTEGLLAPERPRAGEVFDGRYLVLRELGAGGMGAVFEVERQSDARRFALKVVTGRVSGGAAARFALEAEIGARMKHPNLVAIVDVGISRSTTPFLVMELVGGESLESARARFGDVAWGRPLLAQIAEALVVLHANGIVHRDLKPANVLLEHGATCAIAKVADFGISRIDEGAGTAEALAATAEIPTPGQKLTGTGMMLGTPFYMAPESANGEVGPAADVFSFGVLAYEVLTGRAPFKVPAVHLAMATQPLPLPAGEAVGAMAIVLSCLIATPASRPTAQGIVDGLRDASPRVRTTPPS